MSIFENRKIKRILSMENGAHIFLIWVKLLALAGKLADEGRVYFLKELAYSDSDLAFAIDEEEGDLCRALEIFGRLSMMVIDEDGVPRVKNFADYQSIDVLAAIRERGRMRDREEKIRRKEQILSERSEDSDGGRSEGTEEKSGEEATLYKSKEIKEHTNQDEIRIEGEGEEEKNETASCVADVSSPPLAPFGKYKNVMLSVDFYDSVRLMHGTVADRVIDELSAYMASRGATYDNHEAVVDLWIARQEKEARRAEPSEKKVIKPQYNFDPEEAMRQAIRRTLEKIPPPAEQKI